jgi:hypothetical protein
MCIIQGLIVRPLNSGVSPHRRRTCFVSTMRARRLSEPAAPATQSRNRHFMPAFFIFTGAVIAVFAHDGDTWLNSGTLLGGGFVAFGVVLALLGRRYKRELESDG